MQIVQSFQAFLYFSLFIYTGTSGLTSSQFKKSPVKKYKEKQYTNSSTLKVRKTRDIEKIQEIAWRWKCRFAKDLNVYL